MIRKNFAATKAVSISTLLAFSPAAKAEPVSLTIGVVFTLRIVNLGFEQLKCNYDIENAPESECARHYKLSEQMIAESKLVANDTNRAYSVGLALLKLGMERDAEVAFYRRPWGTQMTNDDFARELESIGPRGLLHSVRRALDVYDSYLSARYTARGALLKTAAATYAPNIGKVRPPADLMSVSLQWRKNDSKYANWDMTSSRILESAPEALGLQLMLDAADNPDWKRIASGQKLKI